MTSSSCLLEREHVRSTTYSKSASGQYSRANRKYGQPHHKSGSSWKISRSQPKSLRLFSLNSKFDSGEETPKSRSTGSSGWWSEGPALLSSRVSELLSELSPELGYKPGLSKFGDILVGSRVSNLPMFEEFVPVIPGSSAWFHLAQCSGEYPQRQDCSPISWSV